MLRLLILLWIAVLATVAPTVRSARLVVYLRVSRDRDGTSKSIEQQLVECRAWCKERGKEIAEVFSDNDISAYTGKRRPGWERLLSEIEAGRVGEVLVWEQSRLTRTPAELETYMSVCEPRSVPTYTVVAGTLDLTTDQGRMIARIVGATNRYEVDQLRGRVKRGIRSRASSGEPTGGRRPFGFKIDRITHEPAEAKALRDACTSLLAGDTVHGIVREWRKAGILTTTGRPFSPTQLRTLMKRPRNAGLAENRGAILGPAKWKPIVPVSVWSQVCAKLADPARRTTPGNQPAYLGTFIYRCDVCGDMMRSWRSGSPAIRIYRCSTTKREKGKPHPTIPIAATDEHVADFVVRGLHELGWNPTDNNDDAAGVDNSEKIAELEERRRNLVRTAASGLITPEDLEDALQLIAVQVAELVSELPDVEVRADVTDLLTDQAAWLDLPLDRQRAIIEEFADVRIKLAAYRGQPYEERIEVTLTIPQVD